MGLKKLLVGAAVTILMLGAVVWFGSVDHPDFDDRGLLSMTASRLSSPDNAYPVLAYLEDEEFEFLVDECTRCKMRDYLELREWNPEFVQATLRDTRRYIESAEIASEKNGLELPASDDVFDFPNFGPIAGAIGLLILDSMNEAHAGRIDTAIQQAHSALKLTQLLSGEPGNEMVSWSFGTVMRHRVLNWLHALSVNFALDSEELSRLSGIVEEIPDYPDDTFSRFFGSEFEYQINFLNQMLFGPFAERWLTYWETIRERNDTFSDTSPMYLFQSVHEFMWMMFPSYYLHRNQVLGEYARKFSGLIAQSSQYCSQMKFSESPEFELEVGELAMPNAYGKFALSFMPTYENYFLRRCLADVQVQSVKTIIAIEKYRLDHGEAPASLVELVPDYLASPPVDAFNGNTLQYLREKGYIYSVGADGIDDGGTEATYDFLFCDREPECINKPTFWLKPRIIDDEDASSVCSQCE